MNTGKFVAVVGIVGAIAGIITFGFDIADRFISKNHQAVEVRVTAPTVEEIAKMYKPKFWTKDDIRGWNGTQIWNIELNKNYVIGDQGLLYNGMIPNPSFKNCARRCKQESCDLWIYERSGWCRIYKGNWILGSLGPHTSYNSNDHIVGKRF